MNKKIGFIGCGNMGMAMIGGIVNAKVVPASNVLIFDLDASKTREIENTFGVTVVESTQELVKMADYIVLAVKPNVYNAVLESIKIFIENKVIVTIAAGVTISQVEKIIGNDKRIVRTMPNTPALVGEAMSALCPNDNIDSDAMSDVQLIFESFGKAEKLENI